jgi:hypothetical protein
VSGADEATAWQSGRLDGRRGPSQLLFGRMWEDASIERRACPPGGRIFAIASAGCTALALAPDHEVVAVDVNSVQLEYARSRLLGAPAVRGAAERFMDRARRFAPAVGWSRLRVRAFLELDDPEKQVAQWRREFDTRRFRIAFGALLSPIALRVAYSSPLIGILPPRFGARLRARIERGLARHPNRINPHAHALFAGEFSDAPPPALPANRIEFVQSDAAAFLERAPPSHFDGFTLSNILDGAGAAYGARLFTAIRRAAKPNAIVILRSFAEPASPSATDLSADDRSFLWGTVDVRAALEASPDPARPMHGPSVPHE